MCTLADFLGLSASCWAVPGAHVARLFNMPEPCCPVPAAEPLDAKPGVDALLRRPLLKAREPSRGVLMSLGLQTYRLLRAQLRSAGSFQLASAN